MLAHILALITLLAPNAARGDGGAGVGMAALALQNPRFPVGDVVEVLGVSRRPMVAVLWDTFGKRRGNIKRVVDGVGSPITVGVYLICDPCRMPRRDGKLETFYPQLSRSRLEQQLFRRAKVSRDYEKLARKAIMLLRAYKPNRAIIYPALESTLSPGANRLLAGLIEPLIINPTTGTADIEIVQNPLSIREKIPGYPVELHGYSSTVIRAVGEGGFVSGDGAIFLYPGEPAIPGSWTQVVSYSRMVSLVRESLTKNRTMLLWRPEWQGLPKGGPASKRTYKISNKEKLKALIKLQ